MSRSLFNNSIYVSCLFFIGFVQPSFADVKYSTNFGADKIVELAVPSNCEKWPNEEAWFSCGWWVKGEVVYNVGLYGVTMPATEFEKEIHVPRGAVLSSEPGLAFDMAFLLHFRNGKGNFDKLRTKNEPENSWGYTQCYIFTEEEASNSNDNAKFVSSNKTCYIVDRSKETVSVVTVSVGTRGPKDPVEFEKISETIFSNIRYK